MWLSLVIFLPLVTAMALLFVPSREKNAIHIVSLIGAMLAFLASTALVVAYCTSTSGTAHQFFQEQIQREIRQLVLDPADQQLLYEAVKIANWDRKDPLASSEEQKEMARQIEGRLSDVWSKIQRGSGEIQVMALSLQRPVVHHIQFTEYVSWIPPLGVHYFMGLDGISLSLFWLTSFIAVICMVYSWGQEKFTKAYFILFLFLETSIFGALAALDLFLFYVFWEIILIPVYFLVGIWGGPRRVYAGFKCFIYAFVGSGLLLFFLILIYFKSHPQTFNLLALISQESLQSYELQKWLFPGLFLAFALRIPLVPFHTWLADTLREAPSAVSAYLLLFLNLGVYGFFRVLYPLCPSIVTSRFFLLFFGAMLSFTFIYTALVAFSQRDLKNMLSYLAMGSLSCALLGILSFNILGLLGGFYHIFNFSLIFGLLFLGAGILQERTGTHDWQEVGGIGLKMPVYASLMALGFLALLGIPGSSNFISQLFVFLGIYDSNGSLAGQVFFVWKKSSGEILFSLSGKMAIYILLLGMVLIAAIVMGSYHRIFLGKIKEKHENLKDLQAREMAALIPMAVVIFFFGLAPSLWLGVVEPTLKAWIQTIQMNL